MKKFLSLIQIVLFTAWTISAQNIEKSKKQLPLEKIKEFGVLADPLEKIRKPDVPFSLEIRNNPLNTKANSSALRDLYVEETIGHSIFDNQSNASMPRRLINTDGKLSAIWTFGNGTDSKFPNRGTAYNFYDGSKWVNLPNYDDVTKIEKVEKKQISRTGFSNIVYIPGEGEIIIGHRTNLISTRSDSGAIQITRNSALGSQTWDTETRFDMPLMWPRIAVGGPDGKTIHLIGISLNDTINGVDVFDNMYSALLYCRSLDGGKTWDKKNVLIEGLDSNKFNGFLGDNYSIEASGNTVAFVVGSTLSSVVLFKSTDNGEKWSFQDIKKFQYEPWDDQSLDLNNNGKADDDELVATSDGSSAIYIDGENKIHVWFGNMYIWNLEKDTSGFYTYFPGSSGIYYWNEKFTPGDEPILIAGLVDDNQDDQLDFLLRYDQLYSDFSVNSDPGPFGYNGGVGATTSPTIGADKKGNLYLFYQACKEGEEYYHLGDVSGYYGPSYRHIYMVTSKDTGKTWSAEEDITLDEDGGFNAYTEYAFPSVAKDVNEKIHLIYMSDNYPGLFGDVLNPDLHPLGSEEVNNKINYLSLPALDYVGFNKLKNNAPQFSIYPNPAKNIINIDFASEKSEMASFIITNLIGQVVSEQKFSRISPGKNIIQMDTRNLSSGIYTINVKLGSGSFSGKLVIE